MRLANLLLRRLGLIFAAAIGIGIAVGFATGSPELAAVATIGPLLVVLWYVDWR
jgi:hypothetical protein